VLRTAEFRIVWSAGVLSIVGDQFARVGLSVLVYQRTGSAALTAATYALSTLPALAGGLLLGWLADRYPRRRVMITADLLRAGLLAVMATPGVPLLAVAALLVVVQLAEPVFAGAQSAVVREILADDSRVDDAQRVLMITHQMCLLIGFATGGMLTAHLGAHVALALDAASFAVSAAILAARLRARPVPGATARTRPRILAGAALVLTTPRLRILLGLACVAGATVAPEGLAAPYSAEIGAGPTAIGWLLAVEPGATALGGWLLGRLPVERRRSLLGVLAVGTALPMLGYAAGPGLAAALVLLTLSGACSAYQATAAAAFVSSAPPDRVGSAMSAARPALTTVQGLGVLITGLLADTLRSPSAAIAIAGAAGTLTALVAALAWHRVHRARSA
jgi:MFS family permease